MDFVKKWLENRRIGAALRQYKELKLKAPQANERDLSKQILLGRLLRVHATEFGLRSIEDAEYAIERLGLRYSTISEAIASIIELEDRKGYGIVKNIERIKNSGDLFNKRGDINLRRADLERRIAKIKEEIDI